jgi:plastocyanin
MNLRQSLCALGAAAALAAGASAQNTVQIDLQTISFEPADVTIQVGDTVRWVWQIGFHDVKSGTNFVPNGIFDSGNPVGAPATFEVTFDAAFLAANPVAGNAYDYYCTVHAFASMEGTITVNTGGGSVTPYNGTGINPLGSLTVTSGVPSPGSTINFNVDNTGDPLGGPGFTFLYISRNTAPSTLVVPGWGMTAGAPGEVLINILPPDPLSFLGPNLWAGSGNPNGYSVPIPANPALIGADYFLQGGVLDVANPANDIGLTNGLELVIG